MKIIGHRGARGLAPENTLTGFEKAIEHHVHGIELDVRISKDHRAVLAHNPKIHNQARDTLAVRHSTLAELRAHKADVTTLEEAIASINRRVPIIIEVKPKQPVGPIVTIVQDFMAKGWQPDDLQFISFDYSILKALRKAFPDHIIMVDELWSGVRAIWRARRIGSKDISMFTPFIWTGFVRAISKRGYRLYAFPMNDPKKAKRWAHAGFYGVITDYPERFES